MNHDRRTRRYWIALLTGLLALATVAPASADWTAPFTIATDAGNADVKVDVDGNAVFTWEEDDGVNWRVRTRTADGMLQGARNLSWAGRDAFDSRLAVDAAGYAVFVWARENGDGNYVLRTRTRAPSGAAGPVSKLDVVDSSFMPFGPMPAVAAGPGGTPAFAWVNFDFVWTDRSQPPVSTVFALTAEPLVGVGGDGNRIFSWLAFDGSDVRIQVRAISSTGTRSASGNAIVVWESEDGGTRSVKARTVSTAGVLGGVETLSGPGEDAFQPRIAVNPNGDAVAVYETAAGEIVGHAGP